MLLKELCALCGPTGFEDSVREFIINHSPISEYTIDSIGNLTFHKKGSGKRVMVCAHMDEVGFIITEITEDGFLKFNTLGGINTAVLNGKRVYVGEEKTPGIISAKAIHLQEKEDAKVPTKVKALSIDIGAQNKEDAEKHVEIGDFAVFEESNVLFGEDLVKSKAIDDRAGCAILLELMKKEYESDMYFCFTTQEEAGMRGGKVASYNINPDIALVIDTTTCADVYKSKPHTQVTKLGDGPALPLMDYTAIFDERYTQYIKSIAKGNNIALQFKKTTVGGTDAAAIQKNADGVKTAILSIPCRYAHSPISVAHTKDIENTLALSYLVLQNIERSGL